MIGDVQAHKPHSQLIDHHHYLRTFNIELFSSLLRLAFKMGGGASSFSHSLSQNKSQLSCSTDIGDFKSDGRRNNSNRVSFDEDAVKEW